MNKKISAVIIAVAAAALILVCVLPSLSSRSKPVEETTTLSETTSEEAATIISKEGSYSINVTAVFDAQPDTDDADAPKAERVAVVVYEYTNDDIAHGLSIGETHFKAYDAAGKELQIFHQKGLFEPGEAAESGTFTSSVAFALNNAENYIKIEFYNDPATGICDAVYERTW